MHNWEIAMPSRMPRREYGETLGEYEAKVFAETGQHLPRSPVVNPWASGCYFDGRNYHAQDCQCVICENYRKTQALLLSIK